MCYFGTEEEYHHYCHPDGYCKDMGWRWAEDGTWIRHQNVIYWMPLPKVPKP